MKNTSQCPQCGSNFPYRSNKKYCSSKCKGEAFKQGKAEQGPPGSIHPPSTPELNLTTSARSGVKTTDARSLARIKKMELEHQLHLARLQAEERQRDREHELKKLHTQKEEQEAKLKAARLQLERLQASTTTEKVSNEINRQEVPSKEKSHRTGNPRTEPLKRSLQEEFIAIVGEILDGDEASWSGAQIQNLKIAIRDWQLEVRKWAEKRGATYHLLPQWKIIKDIKEVLAEMQDELSKKSFFENKEVYLVLEPDFVEELQNALE